MAHKLHIPTCIRSPASSVHPPPFEKPLRIQIEGPLVSVQKLLPEVPWATDSPYPKFPQPAALELAKLAYRGIYRVEALLDVPGDLVVRDEYLGWVREARPRNEIDYYGVTFDHNLPSDVSDPEVLQINTIEIEDDNGQYANKYMPFKIDPAEFIGKRILAVPRCCQKRNGTTDRLRINDGVCTRDVSEQEKKAEAAVCQS